MKKVSGFLRQDSSLIWTIINYRDNIYIFMFLLKIVKIHAAEMDSPAVA